jgi:hypothetical protein
MALALLPSNREFLDFYHPYISTEWRRYYLCYDRLKAEYKILKDIKNPNLRAFDQDFLEEIQRVDQVQKTLEVTLRKLFEKCKDLEQFFQLNRFAIHKIGKKFEKLIDKYDPLQTEKMNDNILTGKGRNQYENKEEDEETELLIVGFSCWSHYNSGRYFYQKYLKRKVIIDKCKRDCVKLYQDIFRTNYPGLAWDELEFVKNKDRERKRTRIVFGIKIGLILASVNCSITNILFTF